MATAGTGRGRRRGGSSAGAKAPARGGGPGRRPLGSKPSHGNEASKQPASGVGPGLAVVATPIGNARDISLRALDVLHAADVIACEDTRVTGKLMAMHGVQTRLVAYHDHNAEKARPGLIKRLKKGETVALVSDAGTPLVSDPGLKLVQACLADGITVTPVPGASAVLAALVAAGLPTDRFLFAGFLPPKAAARRKQLRDLARIPATLVVMESVKRLGAALADMADVLGPRTAVVCREMTKLYEETRRGTLVDLARAYAEAPPPKGEATVVVAPPEPRTVGDDEIDQRLLAALENGSVRDAADIVAAETGQSRRRVYARALRLAAGED